MQLFKRFNDTFGVSLHDYWLDNVRGLDVQKLDADVVQSGNRSFMAAVKADWGTDGVAVIKRLMPKAKRRVA